MKLFTFSHHHGYCRLKILGLVLFERDAVSRSDYVRQIFLGGLFSSRKENRHSPEIREKCFCLLGLPLWVWKEDTQYRSLTAFGLTVWRETWEQFIAKSSLAQMFDNAKHIFLFNSNSGEVFLFLKYLLPNLLKHSPEKRFLLAGSKQYHLEMARIICPDMPCTLIEDKTLTRLPSPSYDIGGRHIDVLFTAGYFRAVEDSLTIDRPRHYFSEAIRFFGLEGKLSEQLHVSIPQPVEQDALEKASSLSLCMENFVFLAPEAASCAQLPDEFWRRLAKAFQERGSDIFVNAVKRADFAAEIGKTCCLSYAEAFALARRAKGIVSLRSGLTEFLMDTEVPLDVIYTDFERRGSFGKVPARAVLNGFTLSLLPGFEPRRVREYIYTPDTGQKLLRDILKTDRCVRNFCA